MSPTHLIYEHAWELNAPCWNDYALKKHVMWQGKNRAVTMWALLKLSICTLLSRLTPVGMPFAFMHECTTLQCNLLNLHKFACKHTVCRVDQHSWQGNWWLQSCCCILALSVIAQCRPRGSCCIQWDQQSRIDQKRWVDVKLKAAVEVGVHCGCCEVRVVCRWEHNLHVIGDLLTKSKAVFWDLVRSGKQMC